MKSSPGFYFLLGLLAIVGMAGDSSLLGLLSVLVLGIGFQLLWRPGVSPILIYIFGYQWLQVSTKIFQANLLGVSVDNLTILGGEVTGAILLSMVGLFFLATGMRLGAGPAVAEEASLLQAEVAGTSAMYWFRLYVAAVVVAILARAGASWIPGLSQPFLALASLKWAFYWIFTYATFRREDGPRRLWLIVLAVELLLGLGAYFSDFKTVLFISLLGVIPTGVRLSWGRVLGVLGVTTLTLVFGVVWTAIKPEYRNFLSQGEQAQVVSVGYGESIGYMLTLVGELDGPALQQGASDMADRISYVDIFARAMYYVPAVKPHQDGAVWGDAIVRPFMPRLLFPQKTAINDSDFTNEFTGLSFSGVDEGTSISVGYMGESYIDFGSYFMMVPVFLLGLGLGSFYKWMCNYPASRGLVGMGLATTTLYPAAQFETSATKLIGGLVVAVLMAWIVARWGTPYMHRLEK